VCSLLLNTTDDSKDHVFLRTTLSRQAFIVLGLLDPKHEGNTFPTNFGIYLLFEMALTTQKTLVFSNRAVRISSDTTLPFYACLSIQILSIHLSAPCVCVCGVCGVWCVRACVCEHNCWHCVLDRPTNNAINLSVHSICNVANCRIIS